MFINISNHPSPRWNEAQTETAQIMGGSGDIYDIPFPQIDPTSTTEEVEAQASALFQLVEEKREKYGWPSPPVLLQGEMSFVVALLRLLQNNGYKVYVATTVRNTVEGPDGSKTSSFVFNSFRLYPKG